MSRLVEVQFDGTVWEDLTDYGEQGNIRRGRSGDLALVEAGTCSLLLWNEDGRFTPENTQGAYSPDVKPGVKVRVSQLAGDSGVLVDDTTATVDDGDVFVDGQDVRRLFTGHAVRWEPTWDADGRALVQLDCVDGFETLTNTAITYAHKEEVRPLAPAAYWTLGQSTTVLPEDSGVEAYGMRAIAGTSSGPTVAANGDGSHRCNVSVSLTPLVMESIPPQAWSGTDNDLTLSAVFEWEAKTSDDAGLAVMAAGAEGWAFAVQSGRLVLIVGDGGASPDTLQGDALSWAAETAYQVGFHWDQSTKTVTFYRDGVAVGSDTTTLDILVSSRRRFGVGSPGTDDHIILISEVALWTSDATANMPTLAASVDGYASDLPGERIGRVLDWAGWTDSRDLDDGATPVAAVTSGTALHACQDAGAADGGVFYIAGDGTAAFQGRRDRWETDTTIVATFDDDGTDTPYEQIGWRYDTTYLANDVTVNSNTQGTSDGRATDSGSQGTYGKRDLSISTISNNSADNAARARWELARRKAPHLRLETVGLQVGDPDEQDVASQLELQDLVVANRRPGSGQDDLTVTLRVASIDHTFSGGGWTWGFAVGLLEADSDQPGIYGTAVYGTDVYGY